MLLLMGITVLYIYTQKQYRHSKQHDQGNLTRNHSSPLGHQSSIVFGYAFSIGRLDGDAPPAATEIISSTLGPPHGSVPTRLGGYQSFLERKNEISTVVRADLIPEIDRVQGTSEGCVSLSSHSESSLDEVFAPEPIHDDVPNNPASDPVRHVDSAVERISEETATDMEVNSDPAFNQGLELGSEGEEMDRDVEVLEVDVDTIEIEAEGLRIESTTHSNSSNSALDINATSHDQSVKSKVGKTSHDLQDQVRSGVQKTGREKKRLPSTSTLPEV